MCAGLRRGSTDTDLLLRRSFVLREKPGLHFPAPQTNFPVERPSPAAFPTLTDAAPRFLRGCAPSFPCLERTPSARRREIVSLAHHHGKLDLQLIRSATVSFFKSLQRMESIYRFCSNHNINFQLFWTRLPLEKAPLSFSSFRFARTFFYSSLKKN